MKTMLYVIVAVVVLVLGVYAIIACTSIMIAGTGGFETFFSVLAFLLAAVREVCSDGLNVGCHRLNASVNSSASRRASAISFELTQRPLIC